MATENPEELGLIRIINQPTSESPGGNPLRARNDGYISSIFAMFDMAGMGHFADAILTPEHVDETLADYYGSGIDEEYKHSPYALGFLAAGHLCEEIFSKQRDQWDQEITDDLDTHATAIIYTRKSITGKLLALGFGTYYETVSEGQQSQIFDFFVVEIENNASGEEVRKPLARIVLRETSISARRVFTNHEIVSVALADKGDVVTDPRVEWDQVVASPEKGITPSLYQEFKGIA